MKLKSRTCSTGHGTGSRMDLDLATRLGRSRAQVVAKRIARAARRNGPAGDRAWDLVQRFCKVARREYVDPREGTLAQALSESKEPTGVRDPRGRQLTASQAASHLKRGADPWRYAEQWREALARLFGKPLGMREEKVNDGLPVPA